MKMTLAFPHLPTIEIEMQEDECARLLEILQKQANAKKQIFEQAPLFAEAKPVVEPVKSQPKHGKPAPFIKPNVKEAASQAATQSDSDEARPYKGKANRRHRVLEIFQDFMEKGQSELSIPEITAAFQQRFPEEDSENLDQVVRDMMNKSKQVVRVRRGYYSLSS
jgi:hypothetical protein